MTFPEALEATALAQHLRASRWAYPLVNAGHVAGLGLLVGAVVPMDLRLLHLVPGPEPAAVVAFLRPFAVAGLVMAGVFGGLLFATAATDYVQNGWFRLKMALLAAALVNAGLHVRLGAAGTRAGQAIAAVSLLLWPLVLLAGRMIGYS
ncbi:hypothetical protein [Rubellimicrobium roseum]|uniref:DUF2214 domain-containing protein n=1 Tax=Rubellimicrobium roseum TaxID=687525 RepID=A0A5C4N8W4_9RHOB|nr:hypothetical protein [Rubellimicrobium roseum]TNC66612.1 hypothetical protein FHG71_16170 [Rubellimicrobium roseum]